MANGRAWEPSVLPAQIIYKRVGEKPILQIAAGARADDPCLIGLLSAVDTGFSITCLGRRGRGHRTAHDVATLPNVYAVEIAIHHADPDAPSLTESVRILAVAIEERIGPSRRILFGRGIKFVR